MRIRSQCQFESLVPMVSANTSLNAPCTDLCFLTIAQAAEALGISVENLQAAETGERPLTLNQLRDAAQKYDFPFGYFYLSNPPHNKTFKPVPDFRIEGAGNIHAA